MSIKSIKCPPFFRETYFIIGSLILLWFLVQFTVGRSLFVDMTQEKLYTLSDGTRQVVSRLKDPLTIRLYYSNSLGQQAPQYGVYADRITEMLKAYRDLSNEKITLRISDPIPFSTAEDEAISIGLQGIRSNNGEKLYFGLVITGGSDARQVIPFFPVERENYLEYDLTQAIYKVTNVKQKTLGIISSVQMFGEPASPMGGEGTPSWLIIDQLKTFFDVQEYSANSNKIPEKTDLLMVVQPQKLKEETLKAIDNFIVNGGHAIIFTDPFVEILGQKMDANPLTKNDAWEKMLKTWGVSMNNDQFIADASLGQRVSANIGGYDREITYYGWLRLAKPQMNNENVIVSDVEVLNMASVGSFTIDPNSKLKSSVLLFSSPDSVAMDLSYIRPTPDVGRIVNDFHAAGKSLPLAITLDGTFTSAFDSQNETGTTTPKSVTIEKVSDKNDTQKTNKNKSLLPSQALKSNVSNKKSNVILVADVDMLYDAFWVQRGKMMGQVVTIPTAQNATLVQNALGYLSGNSVLMSVRPRAVKSRTLTVLEKMKRTAEEEYQAKEQKTRQEMEIAEAKLNDLMQKNKTISGDGEKVIQELQTKLVTLRQDLRTIQRSLQHDVMNLQQILWVLNILLMPIIIVLVAFVLLRRSNKIRFFG